LLVVQLLPRLIGATIGASALAVALSLQPLDASPAQAHLASIANTQKAKSDLRQESSQDKADTGKREKSSESKKRWTNSERQELVKRAQVWAPTDIS